MGRPTKLTEETQRKVIQALGVGATYELASQFAGISYETFNNWMKAGAEGKQPFIKFFEAVKEAEGRAAVKWLLKIEQAAEEQWQAAAWKLERRYPQSYGRTAIDHGGAIVTITADQLRAMSEEEFAEVERKRSLL